MADCFSLAPVAFTVDPGQRTNITATFAPPRVGNASPGLLALVADAGAGEVSSPAADVWRAGLSDTFHSQRICPCFCFFVLADTFPASRRGRGYGTCHHFGGQLERLFVGPPTRPTRRDRRANHHFNK